MLRETLAIVVFGLAIGSLAAVALAPLANRLLFGVAPTSPAAIVAAAVALASAATAAASSRPGVPAGLTPRWR